MNSFSMDHYEKKLYNVFKSFDLENAESLDRKSIRDLCDALQLEERGEHLLQSLFDGSTSTSTGTDKVTFMEFRKGLLTALEANTDTEPQPPQQSSDEDSSGREVEPKYVYGSKKYGRRSKPQDICNFKLSPHNNSDRPKPPRNDTDIKKKNQFKCKKYTPQSENKIQPSISYGALEMDDIQTELDHNKCIDYEESIALCKHLRMNRVDKETIKAIFRKDTSGEFLAKMTVGEFFHRLNESLTCSIASTQTNEGFTCNDGKLNHEMELNILDNIVGRDDVIEAWDNAGIEHGMRLLDELRFTAPFISVNDLICSLEAELNALDTSGCCATDAHKLLLNASLILYRIHMTHLKQTINNYTAYNHKLKKDIGDANRRAQILAQEVDENHAKMEESLKGKLKNLEIKHSETMKKAEVEWGSEKELMLSEFGKLEEALTRLSLDENRWHDLNNSLRVQNDQLINKLKQFEEKNVILEEINSHLSVELKDKVNFNSNIKDNHMDNYSLLTRIEELQIENKLVRDKNDELSSEIELLGHQLKQDRPPLSVSQPCSLNVPINECSVTASWCEEAEAVESGLERPTSGKRRGDTPAFTDLSYPIAGDEEDSPRAGKLRRKLNTNEKSNCTFSSELHSHKSISVNQLEVNNSSFSEADQYVELAGVLSKLSEMIEKVAYEQNSSCDFCQNSNSIIAEMKETIASVSTNTNHLKQVEWKNEMHDLQAARGSEERRLNNLLRESENNLEQMKLEYDKCEEYWSSKLEEERRLHDEEQRSSDERLADLFNKISEYEQQFAQTAKMLPTIEEKYSLEKQFNDLEDEFNSYKMNTEKVLDEKNELIDSLQKQIISIENISTNNMNWPKNNSMKRNSARDYHNPAYTTSGKHFLENDLDQSGENNNEISSVRDQEKQNVKLPVEFGCSSSKERNVNNEVTNGNCSCIELEMRCRQLEAALRNHQLNMEALQHRYRGESCAQAARTSAAEELVMRLQGKLAAADILVKELYVENCQLSLNNHHPIL